MGTCATKLPKENTHSHTTQHLIPNDSNPDTSNGILITEIDNDHNETNNTLNSSSNPKAISSIYTDMNDPEMDGIWTKKQILVYGYVEQNYLHYHDHYHYDQAIAIPKDIIDLILKFYDDIFYWTFDSDSDNITFDRFLNTANGETIWSQEIKINNSLIFQYSTCPDGWFPFQKGYVQFYLEVIEIPKDIKEIEVKFKVYCSELKLQWNDTNKFNRIPQAIGWPRYHMRLNDCNKYNSLHFSCFLQVTDIKYKHDEDLKEKLNGFDNDEEGTTDNNTTMATGPSTVITDEVEEEDIDYSFEQMINDNVATIFDDQYL